MRVKRSNAEVFFCREKIIKIGREEMAYLKRMSRLSKRRRFRLCTHASIQDKLHEMFIIHPKGAYVRSHKHLTRAESFCIIEGLADVVIFNDKGNIIEVIRMGDYSSGYKFYYRSRRPYYHTLLIRSRLLVFHEATEGPFRKSDTVFAPWAPKENDKEGVKEFIDRIVNKAKTILKISGGIRNE